MTSRFSIVTPSFRQWNWLQLCATSVADQTGVNLEHIVQDAGTGRELELWAATRGKMRLYVEKDDGMYDAINRGLNRASGEICAWLNCDEQYLPGTLARVAVYFETNPEIEVLFGDAILIRANGRPLSYRRTVLPKRVHTRLIHLNTLSCAMFFRRAIIERGLLLDPTWRTIADAVWIDRLLAKNVRMARMPVPFSVFTMTGANLGQSISAAGERVSWGTDKSALGNWRRWAAILDLRLRKLCAGAYRRRNVTVEIYTPDSPHERKIFRELVGWSWPQNDDTTTSGATG